MLGHKSASIGATVTTEIAILNKGAVALATDSAVTILGPAVGGRTMPKIYANANKLFELIKGVPVGVMIYNSAEVADIPWESLIKTFRMSAKATRRDTLEEYAEAFLAYVQETVTAGLSPDDLDRSLVGHAQNIASNILDQLEDLIKVIPSRVERRKSIGVFVDHIASTLEAVDPPEWSKGIDEKQVLRDLGDQVVASIPATYCGATLTLSVRRKITAASMRLLLRGVEPPPGPWSGVVISGFGDTEVFPALYDVKIGGIARNRLIRLAPSLRKVSAQGGAIIQPYAQTSEAVMFLQGIDPEISAGIREFWQVWAGQIQSALVSMAESAVTLTAAQKGDISSKCGTFMQESWKSFAQYMTDEFHEPRMAPIEASARFLSKGEIADLAETLVELTSLRNRVSLDRLETVGGATDVAVISKGDGFVWIRRKHYFERDRNPSWALRQALTDVGLTGRRLDRSNDDHE